MATHFLTFQVATQPHTAPTLITSPGARGTAAVVRPLRLPPRVHHVRAVRDARLPWTRLP
jgi:hypothetical protein